MIIAATAGFMRQVSEKRTSRLQRGDGVAREFMHGLQFLRAQQGSGAGRDQGPV